MKVRLYYTEITEEKGRKTPGHEEGRELLKLGLLEEYGICLEKETIGYGPHGKPFLAGHPEIHYNISHSGRLAACVFADREIGMDIQQHKKANYKAMLKKMVPPEMLPQILEAEAVEQAFFDQWVLREAYIKWTGEGLSRDLRTISFEDGCYTLFRLEEKVSGALWAAEAAEISVKYVPLFQENGLQEAGKKE